MRQLFVEMGISEANKRDAVALALSRRRTEPLDLH
jgi:hypothetical protein